MIVVDKKRCKNFITNDLLALAGQSPKPVMKFSKAIIATERHHGTRRMHPQAMALPRVMTRQRCLGYLVHR